MDERTRKLLGSATVAVASIGLAAVPGLGAPSDETSPLGASGLGAGGDLLVELMLRTGGSQSVEVMNRELRQMLSYMSPRRFAELPSLVRGLKSLGLSDDAEAEVLANLIDLLAIMDLPLDELLIEQLADALVNDAEQAVLAEPVPLEQDVVPLQPTARGVGLYEG
jgi:hypothetical protein